jgi:hypothetical protein
MIQDILIALKDVVFRMFDGKFHLETWKDMIGIGFLLSLISIFLLVAIILF